MRIHRIVVALGARDACRNFFEGGSGSLPIMRDLERDFAQRLPFHLGGEVVGDSFFHVLDDVSLDVVLRELDTAADFIEYLRKKEEFFSSHWVVATGEEDLLAHYLTTIRNGEHGFVPDGEDFSGLFVDESQYTGLTTLPAYIRSKRANEKSYAWDIAIEYFTTLWRRGEVVFDAGPPQVESTLRLMAEPSRVVRRRLASMIELAITGTPPGSSRCISVLNLNGREIAYGVACLARGPSISAEEHQRRRRFLMSLYARSLRVRWPQLRKALVLGLQPAEDQLGDQDLVLMDFVEWNAELQERTLNEMPLFGLGAQGEEFTEYEFPPG